MTPPRPTVSIIGCRLVPEYHALREFFTRTAQPYEWFEEGSPAADELARVHDIDPASAELPIMIDGEHVVTGATVERVAQVWSMRNVPKHDEYDLVVVGAGPAGLAAAVYAASDGLTTAVIERDVPGGQASHTSLIENFFGFPDGIGGAELASLAMTQAGCFDADILQLRGLERVRRFEDGEIGGFEFTLDDGPIIASKTVIAATGMEWRKLDAPGIAEMLGRGVYYGAGRSEAAQCRDDDVIVVGGGNSAGQAAMFLANSGARVTMLIRAGGLHGMSDYLSERIEAHASIDIMAGEVMEAIAGEHDHLGKVVTKAGMELNTSALFLCLGGVPNIDWTAGLNVRSTKGFILTGPDLQGRPDAFFDLQREPLSMESSSPNFFAAGDVRWGSSRRVGGAVGEGAAAVALVHRALSPVTD